LSKLFAFLSLSLPVASIHVVPSCCNPGGDDDNQPTNQPNNQTTQKGGGGRNKRKSNDDARLGKQIPVVSRESKVFSLVSRLCHHRRTLAMHSQRAGEKKNDKIGKKIGKWSQTKRE
jgi:hypothetical protein